MTRSPRPGCLGAVLLLALVGSCLPSDPPTADPPIAASSAPALPGTSPTTAAPDPGPIGTAASQPPQPTVQPTAQPSATSAALAALSALPVKGRAPLTGYDRAEFGRAWRDVDGNGCDTRNDVLRRDFTGDLIAGNGCTIIGGEWTDPYTGVHYVFDHRPSELDGDHVVALSDAWQKGAQRWSQAKREAFANDPLNVVMTTASLNRQKGDSDAASWLPPAKRARCGYVARQIAVKRKYGLWVTAAERDAMRAVLRKPACVGTRLPSGSARAA